MASHFVTNWEELAAAVAAASDGDWIVIETDELVATSDILVHKSLQFCLGYDYRKQTLHIDYSTGYRLLWAGSGGVLKTIRWHERTEVDCGGDATADAWKCDSAQGPLTFEGHRITIKNLGGNLRCFHGIMDSAVNSYPWTMNLYSCIAHDIGLTGGGGDYSDGFAGHRGNNGVAAQGVMSLYGCRSWNTRDQSLTTHDGCTLNVFGGQFENVFCVGDDSTFYAEDATFDCPATQIYDGDPVVRDQGNAGLLHTFVRCRFHQRAPLPLVRCWTAMTFWDCEFTYHHAQMLDHLCANGAAGVARYYRCQFDASAVTTCTTNKALISTANGTASYVEGCCMIGPSHATNTFWFGAYTATSQGSWIHNTMHGRRGQHAGITVGLYYVGDLAPVKGCIFAGCTTAIDTTGTPAKYAGSANNGLNLFYDNGVNVDTGGLRPDDILGDPGFAWDGVSPMTWDDLQVASAGAAAGVDANPAYQIPSFTLTTSGVCGAAPTTLAWDAKEPASANAKIDLGCYTNRWTTKRTITQEVTLDRNRFVTVALSAPAALGEAAPVI